MIARAPAKINLALVVGPARVDGKHELTTIFQRVGLADRITLEPASNTTIEGFPEDTLVSRALAALDAPHGWRARIEKHVPVAAGLGGGSSDAGTALRLANALLDEPFEPAELHQIAAALGADVPFFLRDGPQLGAGDGSLLEPVDLPQDFAVALLVPEGAVKTSTGDVYAAFDARDGATGYERAGGAPSREPGRRPAAARSRRPAAERPRRLAARGRAARGRGVSCRRQRRRPRRLRAVRRRAGGGRRGATTAPLRRDVEHDSGVVRIGSAGRRDPPVKSRVTNACQAFFAKYLRGTVEQP